jgi:AcrR family transcriptional regulator
MPKQRPATPREPLTRERVLRAAIAFVDENGLGSLSMRRLGQELGVEAMSLYNHVANKDDLLDGITDLVLQQIELPSDADWKSALRRSAVSAYEVFRRHPWACSLTLAPGRVAPTAVRRADWMLKTFRDAGFTPEVTYHAYHALDAHVLGFTLWQVSHGIPDETRLAELAAEFFRMFPEEEYPHMHEHARQHLDGFGRDRPGAFEIVLDLILDGFERLADAK